MKLIATFGLLFIVSSVYGRTGVGPSAQEWGYVTVRPGAHMFWWLQQTLAKVDHYTDRPLVIWLQGGPGASGTGYGNFAELGPLDTDLKPRNTTWINQVNVLFVDNPVGAGFSYVDNTSALTKTNEEIANDFVVLLKGVYDALPELQKTQLYIFTESYGGKMVVDIALALNKAIKSGSLKANLNAIALGDSWISPIEHTLSWSSYLYNLGFVDENGQKKINDAAVLAKTAFDQGQFAKSTDYWSLTENTVESLTGGVDFYNVLTKINSRQAVPLKERLLRPLASEDSKVNTIMNTVVKKTLNLNVTWGAQSNRVFTALSGDFMKPVTNSVEVLLNTTNIGVVVYSGQLDLIVDTIGTLKWLNSLKYPQADSLKTATRYPIVENSVVEGFYKKAGNLSMYWVNRAGHMVPADNPAAMLYILRDVTKNFKG